MKTDFNIVLKSGETKTINGTKRIITLKTGEKVEVVVHFVNCKRNGEIFRMMNVTDYKTGIGLLTPSYLWSCVSYKKQKDALKQATILCNKRIENKGKSLREYLNKKLDDFYKELASERCKCE